MEIGEIGAITPAALTEGVILTEGVDPELAEEAGVEVEDRITIMIAHSKVTDWKYTEMILHAVLVTVFCCW